MIHSFFLEASIYLDRAQPLQLDLEVHTKQKQLEVELEQ